MLRALLIILCMIVNLAIWGTLVLLGGIVKLLTFGEARRRLILGLSWLAERFVQGNNQIFDWFLDTRWDIEGFDGADRDGHYLIISNHISWVDIFALFRALYGKVTFPRFFLKHILIWSPIVGQACWALEFPFMHRYSPEYLKQHPEKRGRDLETTRRFCRRYRRIPVAIINFVEGTRFSRQKHEDQQSPYRFLLRPRVGGISFVLASLSDHLEGMYDVTIVYPRRDVTLWDFVTNRTEWIKVRGRRLEIPAEFQSAAITEAGETRERFKQWVEQVWREKDALIGTLLEK